MTFQIRPRKWKIFSLYHDVGYYFESNIDCGGRAADGTFPVILEYKKIYTHLIFEYVTRSVARTILCAAIIQRSKRTFSCNTVNFIPTKPWKDKGEELLSNEVILNVLSHYEGATIVKDIQSDSAFSHFVMVLDKQKILVIIYDKDEYPIGYVERSGNRIDNFFVVKDSMLDKPEIHGADNCELLFEKIPSDCTLKYCINNAAEEVYAHLPVEYAARAKRYYKQLPEKLRLQLAFVTTDSQINQCYFDLYRWLVEKVGEYLRSEHPISEYDIYQRSIKKYYEAAINNCLAQHIGNIVKGCNSLESSEIRAVLQSIAKSIEDKGSIKKLTDEIHRIAERNYSVEEGVSHDMLTYYTQTYARVLSDFTRPDTETGECEKAKLFESLDSLHFIRGDQQNIIEIEIFKHGDLEFESNLFNQIKKLAKNLDIDFDKLITYSTSYTRSDHGLISAGLLFQAVVFSHYFAAYCKEHDDLKLAWYGLSSYDSILSGKCIIDYAEVIFSILLHNIYTYDSNPVYGINYRHSIDNDAFSYFCAFCDTFQKWHRPKQLDYSAMELPQKHFLGDKFDIVVSEDRICLKCSVQDAEYIRKSLRDENTFLPGIVHLVRIMEY